MRSPTARPDARSLPADARCRGGRRGDVPENLRRAEAKFATVQRLGIDTCWSAATSPRRRRLRRAVRRPAAPTRRPGAAVRRPDGVRSPGVGAVRRRLPARVARRRARRPSRRRRVPRQLPHPVPRARPGGDRGRSPATRSSSSSWPMLPRCRMDVLSWSRHHRLFPGEGGFDLATFLATCCRRATTGRCRSRSSTTPSGRRTGPHRRARAAIAAVARGQVAALPRSAVRPRCAGGRGEPPVGFDFVEIKAEDTCEVEALLDQLGFTPRGRHRTKPVTLWTAGTRASCSTSSRRGIGPAHRRGRLRGARCRATHAARRACWHAGVPADLRRRAGARRRGRTRRHRGLLGRRRRPAAGMGRRVRARLPARKAPVRGIDHVSLSQPWQTVDEAILFFTSVFGLSATRRPRSRAPGAGAEPGHPAAGRFDPHPAERRTAVLDGAAVPQHVAFACADVVALARAARAGGLPFCRSRRTTTTTLRQVRPRRRRWPSSANSTWCTTAAEGEYLHFYTATVGAVFFEFVERAGTTTATAPATPRCGWPLNDPSADGRERASRIGALNDP